MSWPLQHLRLAARPVRSWNSSIRYLKCGTARRNGTISAADLKFGQPVYETHPHILGPGEVTPGISALEYAQRRDSLARLLPQNSVAIIPAADIKYRSGAVFYEFHQDPDFFYLTGFNEPEAVAVIANRSSEPVFHLFVRPNNPRSELWEGARSGVQAALDVFNADEASDIGKIEGELPEILNGAEKIFTDLPRSFQTSSQFARYLSGMPLRASNGIAKAFNESTGVVEPLRPLLNQLRARKSEAEIVNMRKAGQISGRAITDAMRRSFSKEKDLAAFLDYQFKINGCDGPAYVPVIAAGQNALSIHYVRNNDVIRPDDMILVDAGGEYGGYIADITRTWPSSGQFSTAQEDLYTAILTVQRQCVSLCREDAQTTLDKLHRMAETGLKESLKQLGFDMTGGALETLFPHHLSHYIGLDVHDSPGYPRTETLLSGHCVTIEPGIYVPDDERWPKAFRGMGIRIEDSVCVRETSPLVFTTEAVKEVVDIEALRH
ncbi:metallopeptidase family M24 [Trichodelitschia bisporula]|uniref:Xaa-Pro aminopeptidase n=1 Tax=Trichodelitschia bisporula TaxID=703511 RepID=A0A6G1HRH0_9PEZI|nr:metallopeptidase family M24 [Trichodelitschia bisporula]